MSAEPGWRAVILDDDGELCWREVPIIGWRLTEVDLGSFSNYRVRPITAEGITDDLSEAGLAAMEVLCREEEENVVAYLAPGQILSPAIRDMS